MPEKRDLDVYPGDDKKWPVQIRRAQEFTGSMTLGSAVLSSSTATFTSDDVGMAVVVVGAGDSGENLSAVVVSQDSGSLVTLSVASSATVVDAQMFVWRPRDLTGVTITAQGKVSSDDVAPTITFTIDSYAPLEGRFNLILPKEQSVLVEQVLLWDLQTVDTNDGDWTETLLKGKVKPDTTGQVTQ